ncbi:MAG TPA: metalloregulator ArsR/SmtB family transcription factor [Nocardioidaceae bacterium]|nr:metalloregulator ArsR/SmtB family transcription factor [Nocardioidaceae bacterium]
MTMLDEPRTAPHLSVDEATTYAEWFACLADPTRVRALYALATAPKGFMRIGDIAEQLDISQSNCSHHVKRLADVGFVKVDKVGTSSVVTVNQECCTGLPHAADVVMGTVDQRPCCPEDLPADVTVREMRDGDWDDVMRIYAEGIATRNATFETKTPTVNQLDRQWLEGHRWTAVIGKTVVGWAAISPTSTRRAYAGVGETSVYVDENYRGRGVGKALIHRQVNAADDDGLWTLQTSIFPENRASVALHHSAGFRTLGVRERIAQLDGVWRDTVLLERRSACC